MLGQELAKVFAKDDLLLWDRNEIDIVDAAAVEQKVCSSKPDLIINAAAYNAVDDCETNFEIAKKINAGGPVNLAKAANEVGAVLIHYSTDYVFDGNRVEGYKENDIPAPISKYGESKMFGEKALNEHTKSYLIRTSRLFGKLASSEGAKKSFVDVMLNLAENKKELMVVDEELSCPTYVVDLAQATKALIDSKKDFGIYHLTNHGACSWLDFAKEIFKIAKKDVILIPVGSDHFPRPAKRPKFSCLLNTKFAPLRTWQEALKNYLEGQ